jgi:hypothetical protein
LRGTRTCIRSIPEVPHKKLRDFNAEVGRENIFKLTIGNENLHEINNENGVTGVVKFAISKKSDC